MTETVAPALRSGVTPRARVAGLRTVLIFAYECAPYNKPESTIGAQRPAQFAKYLPEFGWRAIVICCDAAKRERGWTAADRDSIATLVREGDQATSLVVPTPSLAWDGLLDRAWREVTRRNGASLIRKSLTFARFFTGDYSRSWQPCARAAAEVVTRSIPVHACIGEHSPDAGIFLARWFSARYHVPWVADFRDPMLFGFKRRVRPLLKPFARRMLKSASHTINVNSHCVALDRSLFGRPASVIQNGFDPEDFAGPAPARDRRHFRIVYVGSVWPPGGLPVFFAGLAELRVRIGGVRFGRIRFVYRGGASDMVGRFATEANVGDVLDCGDRIPHAEAVGLMRSADLLLVLSTTRSEQSDPYWSAGVCPGKSFEYVGAQRPIVCVPGDGGVLDALLRDTRAGTSLGDARAVATYLEAALNEWERVGVAPPLDNRDAILPLSRRAGAQSLAAILNGLASGVSIVRGAPENSPL